jgi:hypothetical protein
MKVKLILGLGLLFAGMSFYYLPAEKEHTISHIRTDQKPETAIGNQTQALSARYALPLPKKVGPAEYIQWINEPSRGMIKETVVNNIHFLVQYHPAAYEVLMGEGIHNLSADHFLKQVKKKEGMQYFMLKIETASGNDILKEGIARQEEYYGRLEYFSFQMQQDVFLKDGEDTLACKLFHYERNFEAAPYTTFMLGFKHAASEKEGKNNVVTSGNKTIIYKDRIFGAGDISLQISEKDLANIPTVNL